MACLRLLGFVIFGRLGPIDDVPPSRQIVRAAILVLEVIGVLPNVAAKDRPVAFHQGVVLIESRNDLQLPAFVDDEPRPTTSETADPSRFEFLFERLEASERGL